MAYPPKKTIADITLEHGLEPRHHILIETMIRYPADTQQQIAIRAGYSPGNIRKLQRNPIFMTEYNRRKEMVDADIRKAIVDATVSAIKFSRNVIEDPEQPVPLRQESARDILVQGHAKAVEKSASLRIDAEFPKEAFSMLAGIAKELQLPMTPVKRLSRPIGEEEPIEVESR